MKRKTFLTLSSALMSAPLLKPLQSFALTENLTNWAGNFVFSTDKVTYPSSLQQLQQKVKGLDKFKALGTRHCFNRIADSKYNLVGITDLNNVVSLNTTDETVTVEGGVKYGVLSPYLHERGYALHNLASLPHISVAGSCATATHGSGVGNGNLATAITAFEMVTAEGDVVQLSKQKDGENFLGTVVGLGALGVVTKLTLKVQPTYQVKQYVYERLPLTQLQKHFNAIVAAGYSVSLFTDWQADSINEVWIKCLANGKNYDNTPEFYGATAATKNLHPIAELSAENCTDQMGVAGAWFERLPHFKMGFTPSSGKELQSEYFIPQQHAVEAIMAIQKLGKAIGPHLFISEIRTIAADDLWMSPCRHQASVALHFTWKQEWDEVKQLLPKIEQELSAFGVRPHWGKLFTVSPKTLHERYDKMDDFKKLVQQYDPKGKLRNEFIDINLFGA